MGFPPEVKDIEDARLLGWGGGLLKGKPSNKEVFNSKIPLRVSPKMVGWKMVIFSGRCQQNVVHFSGSYVSLQGKSSRFFWGDLVAVNFFLLVRKLCSQSQFWRCFDQ